MIKVASYCRVSTDQSDQANSFESQQQYFRAYIQDHPDWELFAIYADEGISGTGTKKRTQFNRMMNDAYEGKFHLIVTKEVSRFSRNILDTIRYTRELRAIGIGVIFANDRINTMEPEGEMLLSFLASLAQEESRRTSSRVVWGQTRQMEKGVVFGRSLLGYDVKNGVLSIDPAGAETVRLIFQKYAAEQVSTAEIARFLTRHGYTTFSGNCNWKSNAVIKILKNEKYAGDLVQKKTYTPDFLSHEKRRNKGAVPFVTIKNHHVPIISREIWNMAQRRLQQNNKHRAGEQGHSNRYVFSGKIRCGQCGSSFVGRFKYLKDGTKIRRWSCAKAASGGTAACDIGKLIRDDDALKMLKTAIRSLPMDVEAIGNSITELITDAKPGINRGRTQNEIVRIQQKKVALLDSFYSGEITKADMTTLKQRYENQILKLQNQNSQEQDHHDPDLLQQCIQAILKGDTESEVFYKTLLDSLTVFKDRHMELRLKHLPQVFHFSE